MVRSALTLNTLRRVCGTRKNVVLIDAEFHVVQHKSADKSMVLISRKNMFFSEKNKLKFRNENFVEFYLTLHRKTTQA